MSTSVSKMVAERNHRTLLELTTKPGNDVCADCRARVPRWASHNLGIFICVSCASVHRKIGTHITKVKSITLDEWTKEQVEVMKERGNIKSNALYNPDEARHPPPTNLVDSGRDSELEKFIRSKYEFKRFMHKKSTPTSRYLAADTRVVPTTPQSRAERKVSPGPPLPPKTPENLPSNLRLLATIPSHNVPPTRSFSQSLPPLINSDKLTTASPLRQHATIQPSVEMPSGQAWKDLISLQEPSQSSSLPLQYSPVSPTVPFPPQPHIPVQQSGTLGNTPNPFVNLSLGQASATTPVIAGPVSVPAPSSHFPYVLSVPLPAPALPLSGTYPFGQAPLTASATGTTFSTHSNPFSSSPVSVSMTISTPTTPSARPVMALPTGGLLHTPPLPYVTPQASTLIPGLSFPPTPFAMGPPTPELAQNPFLPVSTPGQVPLSANVGATNPFSTMQIGQAGVAAPATPQAAFGTTAFLSQQRQQQQPGPNGVVGWAGLGAHETF